MTGLDDEVARFHAEAQQAERMREEWRRRDDEERAKVLDLQLEAAERLKTLQVGARLVLLKPAGWFDNPDFGRDGSGWRRTSTQPRCWVLVDRTEYAINDSIDLVAELLLEDGRVVGITPAIYVPSSLPHVFAVSQMPPVLAHWPGTPYVQDGSLDKARERLAKLIVEYERKQTSAG